MTDNDDRPRDEPHGIFWASAGNIRVWSSPDDKQVNFLFRGLRLDFPWDVAHLCAKLLRDASLACRAALNPVVEALLDRAEWLNGLGCNCAGHDQPINYEPAEDFAHHSYCPYSLAVELREEAKSRQQDLACDTQTAAWEQDREDITRIECTKAAALAGGLPE